VDIIFSIIIASVGWLPFCIMDIFEFWTKDITESI